MIKKKYSLVLIIILVTFNFIGCWDYRDINKTNISISTGLDIVEENIQYTGEVAKINTRINDKDNGKNNEVYNFIAEGENFEEARTKFDVGVPYPHFLGAARTVIFSSKYSQQSIAPYLNRISNIYDYRKTILPVISREPPIEIFSTKVENDISVAFLIEDIIGALSRQGKTLYVTVGDLLSDISYKNVGSLIPYIGIENNSIKYLGLVVMKDMKMVGIFDVENTNGILYLLAKKPSININISVYDKELEPNKIVFLVSVKKRKIDTSYVNDKININVDLEINATLTYQYYPKAIDDKNLKELENTISKRIKEEVQDTIFSSQHQYNCDFLQFSKYFRAQNPMIYRKINWNESYKDAAIRVDVRTKINSLGLNDPNAKSLY